MEMTVQDYAAKLEAGEIATKEKSLTAASAQQATELNAAISEVLAKVDDGQLARYDWTVKTTGGDDISIRFETNLINIPMDEALRLDGKLLAPDKNYPVNLYLVAESPDVNRTGLRIDSLVDNPSDHTSVPALVTTAQQWVANQLTNVVENRQKAKEEATKPQKTTKKATTKKKTTRRRRSTTKKSTKKTTK